MSATATATATVDVVVSVYRDSLEWLGAMQNAAVNLCIYDKWDNNFDDRDTDYSNIGLRYDLDSDHLPNVGMCDHTYLHHIVERYDSLADWTVFTPDGPHDHLPPGVSMADALTPGDCLRVPRVWRGRDWDPVTGRLNWEHWGEHRDRNGESWRDRYKRAITPAKLDFVSWMRQYIGFDPNGTNWPGYAPGGVMAVPRRAITYLPRAFYERLREQVSHSVQPEEGHYVERSWVCVFSGMARYQETA